MTVRTVVVTIVPDPQVLYFQRPRAHRPHAGLAFFGAPHARGCCGQHRCTSSNGWRKWCGVRRHTSPWVSSGQNCTNLINTTSSIRWRAPRGPEGWESIHMCRQTAIRRCGCSHSYSFNHRECRVRNFQLKIVKTRPALNSHSKKQAFA